MNTSLNLSIYLVLLFHFSVTSGLPSRNTRHNRRTIEGDTAVRGQFPFVVSIGLVGTGHICGGSIINEKFVLTAAQCVSGYSPSQLTVLAGTNLLNGTDGTVFNVSGMTVHEDFTNNTYFFNDIAIVKIDGVFEFNALVKKGRISAVEDYQILTLVGWGDICKYRNELQYIKVLRITRKDCDKMLPSKRFYPRGPGQFCSSSFRGACMGDLGGPLIDGGVVGIVSYRVINSLTDNEPLYVYTAVQYYEDWISSHSSLTTTTVTTEATTTTITTTTTATTNKED